MKLINEFIADFQCNMHLAARYHYDCEIPKEVVAVMMNVTPNKIYVLLRQYDLMVASVKSEEEKSVFRNYDLKSILNKQEAYDLQGFTPPTENEIEEMFKKLAHKHTPNNTNNKSTTN